MSTKEKKPIPETSNPIPETHNPIPETRKQGKPTSDRMHIDPLQKKTFDMPNTGGRSGKSGK